MSAAAASRTRRFQVPLAGIGRQVHGERLVDVVGAAAGAVEQVAHGAVRGDQVDDEVTAVGVHDVDRDLGGRRGVARAAGDRDRRGRSCRGPGC